MKARCLGILACLGMSWAQAQEKVPLQAHLRLPQDLHEQPNAASPKIGPRIEMGEPLMALGESYGGAWVKVIDLDRREGWIPITRVDLKPAEGDALDDFRDLQDRLQRLTSRWTLDLPIAAYGTGPLGMGGGVLIWLNLARNGILDYRDDQLEFGTGAYFWRGQATDTTAAAFIWEIPVHLQWLFRLLKRGALMTGPRVGFSVLRDPTFEFRGSNAVPFRGGWHARYFIDDDIGFSLSVMALARSVTYITGEAGVSWRF